MTVHRRTRIVSTPVGQPLTARAKRFALAYVANDGNGRRAALAAGYSPNCADHRASMLLRHAGVLVAINAEEERLRLEYEAECERANRPDLDAVRAEARAAVEAMLKPRRNAGAARKVAA
jgi:phage terminase small subunit